MASRVELAQKPRPRLPLLRTFYWLGVAGVVGVAATTYMDYQMLKQLGDNHDPKSHAAIHAAIADGHKMQANMKKILEITEQSVADVQRSMELYTVKLNQSVEVNRLASERLLQKGDEKSRKKAAYYAAIADVNEKALSQPADMDLKAEVRRMNIRHGQWLNADAFDAAAKGKPMPEHHIDGEGVKRWEKVMGFDAGPVSAGIKGSASWWSRQPNSSKPSTVADPEPSQLKQEYRHDHPISIEKLDQEMSEMEKKERENKAKMLNDYDSWLKESTDNEKKNRKP